MINGFNPATDDPRTNDSFEQLLHALSDALDAFFDKAFGSTIRFTDGMVEETVEFVKELLTPEFIADHKS